MAAILTHTHPDLDALLCVWLLKRYGEPRYPGVARVPVLFAPAGQLPDGLDADTLERERGILAVDTGGGRLDTHARGGPVSARRQEASASWLVAEDLGLSDRPELAKLLEFVRLQETRGRSIESRRPMDHLVSLPNLVRGLNLCHPDHPERVLEVVFELFDGARAMELDWIQATRDYATARVIRLSDKTRLVGITSDSGSATKVARLHQADLVVHRNAAGHTGITVRTKGRLRDLDLSPLAAVLRVAEARAGGAPVPSPRLRHVGMVGGWYLHDSGRILSKGSARNPGVPPSRLTVDAVLEIAAALLAPERGMPAVACPLAARETRGCDGCPLLPLSFDACLPVRAHRRS